MANIKNNNSNNNIYKFIFSVIHTCNVFENEPPHDKTNKMACAPTKTDQSDQSLCCPHEESLGP